MKNEQIISEMNKKVEHYFSLVKKHRTDGNFADAAVNARHILETLLKVYTEQYLPEAAYLKTFDQIEELKAAGILSKPSGDTLHGVRMTANRGAHEDEKPLTGKDISSMMAGLNKEYEILKQYLQENAPKEVAIEIAPKEPATPLKQPETEVVEQPEAPVPAVPESEKAPRPVAEPQPTSAEKKNNIRVLLAVFGVGVLCILLGSLLFRGREDASADVPGPTKTEAPTETGAPDSTSTPVPTATSTPTPEPTSTPMPTATPVPTATNTPVPTATNTPVPTATSTPTPIPVEVASVPLTELRRVNEKNFAFATSKQTDTIGNEYRGENIATITMTGSKDGYADFYVGGEYNYISGVLAPHDSTNRKRTGIVIIYVKEDGGEWYEIYNTKDIHRTVAPFSIEVDISGADWVSIKYTHVDSNTSSYNVTNEEGTVILSQFAVSNESRGSLEVKRPDYGEAPLLSDVKIARSYAMEFVTKKLTDNIGNEYVGKNLATLTMTGKTYGYADYYTGGKYRYFSGVIAVNDTSSKVRTGKITVFTKEEDGSWYEVYSSGDLHRTVGPFQIEVDISGGEWMRIKYEHIDNNVGSYNSTNAEASVILSQCAFSNESRGSLEVKHPDYGVGPTISEIKVTRSVGLEFVTTKQTDTLGNEYVGKNVANLSITGRSIGYVDYFIGGKYRYLKGEIAVNDTSSKKRTGKITVYTKEDGGEWIEAAVIENINRETIPFSLEVDINYADWISIKYEHTDSNTGTYNSTEEKATIILSGMTLVSE